MTQMQTAASSSNLDAGIHCSHSAINENRCNATVGNQKPCWFPDTRYRGLSSSNGISVIDYGNEIKSIKNPVCDVLYSFEYTSRS